MIASEAISPTAHYTGYVWARNGLSHPALATLEGRLLYESLRPPMLVNELLGRPTLEGYLLARHRAIDALLTRAIEQHGISQVIEVAAGLSPRGWRFTRRYGERLLYVEADLPRMAARKRRALEEIGSLGESHFVRELDVLREDGPESLAALAAGLDPGRGLVIITEGLLGYLPRDAVEQIWRRFASVLGGFSADRYISEIHLSSVADLQVRAFRVLLGAFVRGRVYLHFDSAAEVVAALRAAGFSSADVTPAAELVPGPENRGSSRAHILEASTR
ncbi:MAG TPA: class I SAM-dependent methyltransferase [Solirubrobacteraceae bacterium]|nr:class I SAM-dependent methyltransferase [Solirubrobacteraceae bacterium]